MYAIDPRRTSSAQWADVWLGIDVGSDIALANAMGREIIAAGLVNERFVAHSTTGFDAYAAAVEPYTLARAEEITGVPATVIRSLAHDYASARTGPDLLDARDHGAPQRNRQRPFAHQPRSAHGPCGALRLRPRTDKGPEQRAGWRGHGGVPQQAARIPGRRRIPSHGGSSKPCGGSMPGRARPSPLPHVRGDGSRRPPCALCHR